MRWRCVMAAASLVERTLACQAGMPMATRMPMIEMTIISSTSEKPRWRIIFLSVLILLNLTAFTVHVSNGSEFHKAATSSDGAAVGPSSGGKILLYGTAQVTPASKEGKSKKAKGES